MSAVKHDFQRTHSMPVAAPFSGASGPFGSNASHHLPAACSMAGGQHTSQFAFAQNFRRQNSNLVLTEQQSNLALSGQQANANASAYAAAAHSEFSFIGQASAMQHQRSKEQQDLHTLRIYFGERKSDKELLAVYEHCARVMQAAFDKLSSEEYAESEKAHLLKVQQTEQLYQQSRGGTGDASKQAVRPSTGQQSKQLKRKRNDFNRSQQAFASGSSSVAAGGANTQLSMMQAQQAMPQHQPQPLPRQENVHPNRVQTAHASAPMQSPQQPAQRPHTAQPTSNSSMAQENSASFIQYKQFVASQVNHRMLQTPDHEKNSLLQGAFDHLLDKQRQRLEGDAKEQNGRLENDNRILKRGFKAMYKRQDELVSENGTLKRELENLKYQIHFLMRQQQPSQASYASMTMQQDHNNFEGPNGGVC